MNYKRGKTVVEFKIIYNKVGLIRPYCFYLYNHYGSSNLPINFTEMVNFCEDLPRSIFDKTVFGVFTRRYQINFKRANYFNTWPYICFKYESDAVAFKMMFA